MRRITLGHPTTTRRRGKGEEEGLREDLDNAVDDLEEELDV